MKMGFASLLYKFHELVEHSRFYRKCRRCLYQYDTRKGECAHCSNLDQAGLDDLFQQRKRQFHGRRHLGIMFIFAAVILVVVLIASLMS
jgi:hypothetical protein